MITTRITRSARAPPRFCVSTSGCASGAEDPDDSILPLLTVRGHATTNITVFWLTTRNVVLAPEQHTPRGPLGLKNGWGSRRPFADSIEGTARVLIEARIYPAIRHPRKPQSGSVPTRLLESGRASSDTGRRDGMSGRSASWRDTFSGLGSLD